MNDLHLASQDGPHAVFPDGPPCSPSCPGSWSTWHDGYADGFEAVMASGSPAWTDAWNAGYDEAVSHGYGHREWRATYLGLGWCVGVVTAVLVVLASRWLG